MSAEDQRKLSDYVLFMPVPPAEIGHLIYDLRSPLFPHQNFVIPRVQNFQYVAAGDPVVSWGTPRGLSLDKLVDIFTPNPKKNTDTTLIAPAAGRIEWVSDHPNVATDWSKLRGKPDYNTAHHIDPHMYAFIIRPYQDACLNHPMILEAYSHLVQFATDNADACRHKNTLMEEIEMLTPKKEIVPKTLRQQSEGERIFMVRYAPLNEYENGFEDDYPSAPLL